jgi:TonB family protein
LKLQRNWKNGPVRGDRCSLAKSGTRVLWLARCVEAEDMKGGPFRLGKASRKILASRVRNEMSPIIKDSDTATASRETARSDAAGGSSGDSPVKQQPVALEIPITINGVRAAEGSDKREPFSESTKTVMVFGSGAVIRLSSALAPGQLLFLTNDRTKKEVVCQVVKSKNYRSASGYVELQFTEPAVGFWGMRFPGDHIGAGPQAAPEAARPTSSSSSVIAAKPSTPAPIPSKPAPPATAKPSVVPAPVDSGSLLGGSKSKPGVSTVPVVPTSLGSDAPLVEPWLKKREPAAKASSPPPSTASREAGKSEGVESSLPTTRSFELSHPSDKQASIFAPAEAPANAAKVDLSNLAPFFEVKPGPVEAPAPPPSLTPSAKAPAASDTETEELKQHTARLQEELSQMQFAGQASSAPAKPAVEATPAPAAASEPSVALPKADPVHESAVRLVEDSGASNAGSVLTELPEHEEPAKAAPPAPIAALETLEQEELKIPAWLAPLARNASAPPSTQESGLREKAKRAAERPQLEEVTAPLGIPAEKEKIAKSRAPQFGTALPFEETKSLAGRPAKKSGKGMLFGTVAAGILLLAGGGWWYVNQQSAGVHASVPPVQEANVPAAAQDSLTNSPKEAALGPATFTQRDTASSPAKPAAAHSNAPIPSATSLSSTAPSNASPAAARNPQTAANSPNNSLNKGGAVTTASSEQTEPVPAEVKKPVLGEVHLAKPKVSQKRTAQTGAAPDAEISLNDDPAEANPNALGADLGIANNQPTAPTVPAPVAVGGDVKQAKLISQVQPTYPALAKAQHISGGVTIDALIDATGRVTKMKVLSGPVLLQQAAIDSLKQWKYQPATLDGKAVPMHVTVTLQFRLQ